jgi:DNA polymerase-3 subunit alpha
MALLPRAIQGAAAVQNDRRTGQSSLFGSPAAEEDSARPTEALPDLPEWPDTEKLKYEKEALDFYFSSHPLAQHAEDLRKFCSVTVEELRNLHANQEVTMGGMLTQVRYMNTKKARNGNSRYLRCKLEDFTGSAECVMWPDDFVRHKDEIAEDRVCFVKGTVERTREEPGLVLTRIFSVEQAQRELTKGLVLYLNLPQHTEQHIEAIARTLKRTPGPCPVFLHMRDAVGKRCRLRAGEGFRVNPATVSTAELETILGAGSVKFAGPTNGIGRNGK